MIIDNFESFTFIFTNLEEMTLSFNDISLCEISDDYYYLDDKACRLIHVVFDSKCKAKEWNKVFWEQTTFKKPIQRLQYACLKNDIERIVIRDDFMKERRYKLVSSNSSFNGVNFNLYQHCGYQTDDDYNQTGYYEVYMFAEIKKHANYQIDASEWLKISKEVTQLKYDLLISKKEEYVLVDCIKEFIPLNPTNSHIMNFWLENISLDDPKAFIKCMQFIKLKKDVIEGYQSLNLTENDVIERMK